MADAALEPVPERAAREPRAPWAVLLGSALALGLWSWLRVEGALFADVVEYLERASAFVRGEELIDAQSIRAAGVTALHAPVLWLAHVVGIPEGPWVLAYASVVHLAIAALFVVASVHSARSISTAAGVDRQGARLAGWAAGSVAVASPTFVQFAPIAMTDIASGAALAYGMATALTGKATARRGATAGAWLGLAALCAFKTIPLVAGTVLAALALRPLLDGWRPTVRFAAALAAVLGAIAAVQCTFDLLTYGGFGAGLGYYLAVNLGSPLGTYLYQLGLVDLGQRIYFFSASLMDVGVEIDDVSRRTADFRRVASPTWYFDHFQWFAALWLVPLAALGTGLAALRSARIRGGQEAGTARRIARVGLALAPLLVAAPFVALTATKGAKEMRIWLPLLPLFAAYAGLGAAVVAGWGAAGAAGRFERARAALAATLLAGAVVQGVVVASTAPRSTFAAFERAARWLQDAPHRAEGRAPRVASSYHWAILFRTPPGWEAVKLPHQPDQLAGFVDPETRAAAEARTLAAMRAQDALIVHSSLLRAPWTGPLVEMLSEEFHVAAAFWDRRVDSGIGCVLVFTRGAPESGRRRVLQSRDEAPDEPVGLRLERQIGEEREELRLAGLRVERLPGDGLDWVEIDIDQRGERVVAAYALVLRVADATGTRGFQEVRRLGWGKLDLRTLPTGTRWTEGLPIAPTQGPAALNERFEALRPGGRAYLWFDLATLAADEAGERVVTGRVEPMAPGADHAERDDLDRATGTTDGGWRFAPRHGEVLVASFEAVAKGIALRLESALAGQ
ncbi:MAG: hypothetical protein AAGB93_01620 [Planctomycetota bacterium]